MNEFIPPEHRALPVRKVHAWRTLLWLSRGWGDFTQAPLLGLAHGVAMGLFGAAMLFLAWDRFWVLAGAFSGFLLVAPILSTGLYAVSRALLRGEDVGLSTVWAVWRSLDRRLVWFGVLLTLMGTAWVMSSAALITLGVKPAITTPTDFLHRVVLAPNGFVFEAWLLLGGLMATPLFASSVVAIPLLLDRQVSLPCALRTSWRAVAANPVCLGLWAAIVMTLTLAALGGLMFGLSIVIPLLGHATWHAYRDLVVRAPD